MESSSHKVTRSAAGDRVLVIMAKAPRPGSVKTRLSSSLSVESAVSFYRCLLEDTLALAFSLSGVHWKKRYSISSINSTVAQV